MKLEELNETTEEELQNSPNDSNVCRVQDKVRYFQMRTPSVQAASSSMDSLDSLDCREEDEEVDEEDNHHYNQYSDLSVGQQTSKETGVQRQLATIKAQKEQLIKEIVENEKVGRGIQRRLEEQQLATRDLERYCVFLAEMEKVVLLLLSLCARFERAEEELSCGNLTDWQKESIRFKRDKLETQLKEAHVLKTMSDRRQERVESLLRTHLDDAHVHDFRGYIARREQLLRSQRACEEAERSILPSSSS